MSSLAVRGQQKVFERSPASASDTITTPDIVSDREPASHMSSSSPSVGSLPAEIQLQILSHCDRQDVLSLRGLDKSWLDTITDTAFSDVKVCMFTWSFERLHELSLSTLAKKVKRLTFYSANLAKCKNRRGHSSDDEDAEWVSADFEDAMTLIIRRECRCVGDRGLIYYVPKKDWKQAEKTYTAFYDSQTKLWQDEHYMELFKEALTRFSNLQSLEISHFPPDDYDPRTRHLRPRISWDDTNTTLALAREMTHRIGTYERVNEPRAVPTFLEPIISSPASFIHLRRLRIQQRYDMKWDVAESLRPVLDHLEELELEIKTPPWYTDEQRASEADLKIAMMEESFELMRSPNLKTLILVGPWQNPDKGDPIEKYAIYDEFFSSQHWPSLRTLHLEVIITRSVLESFLKRHSQTLRKLVLKNCYVDDAEAFLSSLPGLVRLKDVEIVNLYTYDADVYPYRMPHYFEKGLEEDQTAKAWLLCGVGPAPHWQQIITPEYDGGCFSEDLNADIPLDVEFDRHY